MLLALPVLLACAASIERVPGIPADGVDAEATLFVSDLTGDASTKLKIKARTTIVPSAEGTEIRYELECRIVSGARIKLSEIEVTWMAADSPRFRKAAKLRPGGVLPLDEDGKFSATIRVPGRAVRYSNGGCSVRMVGDVAGDSSKTWLPSVVPTK